MSKIKVIVPASSLAFDGPCEGMWLEHAHHRGIFNKDRMGLVGVGTLLNEPFQIPWTRMGDTITWVAFDGMPYAVTAERPGRDLREVLTSNVEKAAQALLDIPAGLTCDRCGGPWTVWMVRWRHWKLVGNRWTRKHLCWDCYRTLTRAKGGARRPLTEPQLERLALAARSGGQDEINAA